MLVEQRIASGTGILPVVAAVRSSLAAQILADSDEFHLGRDNAVASVMHLRHALSGPGSQRSSPQGGKIFEPALFFLPRVIRSFKGEIAIINRFQLTPLIFLH